MIRATATLSQRSCTSLDVAQTYDLGATETSASSHSSVSRAAWVHVLWALRTARLSARDADWATRASRCVW